MYNEHKNELEHVNEYLHVPIHFHEHVHLLIHVDVLYFEMRTHSYIVRSISFLWGLPLLSTDFCCVQSSVA
jgi:hypothetical protein